MPRQGICEAVWKGLRVLESGQKSYPTSCAKSQANVLASVSFVLLLSKMW